MQLNRRIKTRLFTFSLTFFLFNCGSKGANQSTQAPAEAASKKTAERQQSQPKPEEAWKKIFASVEFEGASITNSKVDGEPTGLPLLKDRFMTHIQKVASSIKARDNFTPLRIFVGVDYFYPSGQGFLELLNSARSDTEIAKAIRNRARELMSKHLADQYYIGIGPTAVYTYAPTFDTLDFGNHPPKAELVKRRYQLLVKTLQNLLSEDPYKAKWTLVQFDSYISPSKDAPLISLSLKSMFNPGEIIPVMQTIGLGKDHSHPNALGQALTVNYVIDSINHKNEADFEIPFLDEKAPL